MIESSCKKKKKKKKVKKIRRGLRNHAMVNKKKIGIKLEIAQSHAYIGESKILVHAK